MTPLRIFLLSPARLDGVRAQQLFAPKTSFPLARNLRTREGVPLGEVYRFLSSLYFRGKLAYARRFGRPPSTDEGDEGDEGGGWLEAGALVITPSRGLLPPDSRVCLEHLEEFREVPIGATEPRFRKPLVRDAALLREALGPDGQAILLGSIATPKYTQPLREALGDRLMFPKELIGRGDMSRGGLLLRCVESGTELTYEPLGDLPRRGPRPPRLGTKPNKRSPGDPPR